MRTFCKLAAIVFTSLGLVAHADESIVENYLLLPVRTEYQRAAVFSDATAYALINSSAIAHDGIVDAKQFDVDGFRAALSSVGGSDGAIMVYSVYSGTDSNSFESRILEAAVKNMCREAGFGQIRTGGQYRGDDWQERVAAVQADDSPDDADETGIVNERVRAYPLRTRLSRLIAGGADCFVEIRPAFDGRMTELPSETRAAIEKAVGELALERKRKLAFRITTTTAGKGVAQRFVSGPGGEPADAEVLARRLGFQTSITSQVPTSGAPEFLVGQPAPDFSLEALDGNKIRLVDAVRDKVALVTFWGVACGPCRQEAPHLSALYEKYGNADFTVIAVNGYDESKEVVAEYSEEAGLVHPIALMGGEVAREQYAVGAYPTTFWLDANGTVIDYVIGFDPGDEEGIERRVQQLLERQGNGRPPTE